MEILITLAIFIVAGYILYKNIKSSAKGECNCSDCDSKCPKYNNNILIKK